MLLSKWKNCYIIFPATWISMPLNVFYKQDKRDSNILKRHFFKLSELFWLLVVCLYLRAFLFVYSLTCIFTKINAFMRIPGICSQVHFKTSLLLKLQSMGNNYKKGTISRPWISTQLPRLYILLKENKCKNYLHTYLSFSKFKIRNINGKYI